MTTSVKFQNLFYHQITRKILSGISHEIWPKIREFLDEYLEFLTFRSKRLKSCSQRPTTLLLLFKRVSRKVRFTFSFIAISYVSTMPVNHRILRTNALFSKERCHQWDFAVLSLT